MNGFISKYRWIIIIVAIGIATALFYTDQQVDETVPVDVEEPETVEVVAEPAVEPTVEPEIVDEPEVVEVIAEPVAEPEVVAESEPEPEIEVVPEETLVEVAPDVEELAQEEVAVVEPVVEEKSIIEVEPEVQSTEPEVLESTSDETVLVEITPIEIVEEEVTTEEVPEEVVEEDAVVDLTEEASEDPAPIEVEVPAEEEPVVDVEQATEEAVEETEEISEAESILEDLTATVVSSSEDADTEEGTKPSFDVVRVDTTGTAVIAGNAEPYSKVVITSNGEEIGEAIAGGSGEFVAIIQVPENDQGQTLELESEVSGQLLFSDETILILPIMHSVAADTVVEESAPPIIRATKDEVVIIQGAPKLGIGQVSLDSISYDENDEVVLAGRGSPGRTVIIYVDDTPLMDTVVSDSGSWTQALHGLDAGRYVLRVDEIDEDGNVTSRVESPFQREYPEDVREAKATNDTTYTVQPGNSLWVIATGRYGDGMQYHQIFSANKDQIRDPDLIYPGQVFAMPDSQE